MTLKLIERYLSADSNIAADDTQGNMSVYHLVESTKCKFHFHCPTFRMLSNDKPVAKAFEATFLLVE